MTRRLHLSVAAIAALAGGLVSGQTTPPAALQPFRTSTDVVVVNVSVKRGGIPVPGLTAGDFQVRDNNVTQRIESVDATAGPLDVTLVLDVSGFPHSRVARAATPDAAISRLNAEVAKIAAMLRPVDRVRVIASDTYVQEVVPLSPVPSIPPVRQLASGGLSSTFDSILAALLQPVAPDRRHIIMASVKVFDTMSAIEAGTLGDVAARSDALLHIVLLQTDSAREAAQEVFQCEQAAVCTPVARSWTPYFRLLINPLDTTTPDGTSYMPQLGPDGRALQDGAEATGGGLHQGTLMSAPTLAGTLTKAFDEFRTGYVLRFTPQGVKREGWHDLTVTVPGARGATVHARNGYGIDWTPTAVTTSPPRPNSGRPATIAAPRTPEEFAAAYDRADRDAIRLGLERTADPVRVLQDIAAAGNPWPGSARREADYALELADAGLSVSGMAGSVVTGEVSRLIGRFSRLVRNPIEPDAFERAWLWAAICLAEGKYSKIAAAPVVEYALQRFPTDPRFVLARAIVADQRWRTSGTVAVGGVPPASDQIADIQAADVMARYRAASTFAETRTEADVRLAWFLHRIGHDQEALAALEAAPVSPQDSAVSYLRHLFMGHVLVAMDRLDDAIAAYGAAVTDVPDAQSARVALMSALAAHGDRGAAEDLGRQIEMAPSRGDPWFNYWFGDARWYAQARNTVRAFGSTGTSTAGKSARPASR